MRVIIGYSSTGIWARSMSGSRAMSSNCWPTQPSELPALTADLSAGETEALLQRLLDVQGERERANGPRQLRAEVRAVCQREQELADQLTALLDDAQIALCESLPQLPGADTGEGGGDEPPITEAPR